ncbi:hypothetical protein, partial [Pseudomonas sp. 2822-17]|uniref:hypothetical protein n=1 Tax=Pseudomonas sp. 2822-17 TaxID=1712678 RepID=UPI00117A2D54
MKDTIEEINKKIDRYNGEIGSKAQEQENLRHLETTLKDKKQLLHDLGVELDGLRNQVNEKERRKEGLDKEFTRMLSEKD